MAAFTLGTWGWQVDGDNGKVYRAPIYEHGTNALAYWAEVKQEYLPTSKLTLWKAIVKNGDEQVATALKIDVAKAKAWVVRWIEELAS